MQFIREWWLPALVIVVFLCLGIAMTMSLNGVRDRRLKFFSDRTKYIVEHHCKAVAHSLDVDGNDWIVFSCDDGKFMVQ